MHLVHVTTVPDSLVFIAGQITFMQQAGIEVTVVTSPGAKLDAFAERTGVRCFEVDMPRKMTPRRDAKAVVEMTDLFLDLAPTIVHAHTPKGGLIGMTSASLAQVKSRVYQMRGLLTLTASGWRKTMFANAERVSCGLAHHVVCQSHSLRKVALETKLVRTKKSSVICGGSNGVDARVRFKPTASKRKSARLKLGFESNDTVVGFVGRLVGDKGIRELHEAWQTLRKRPNLKLLLVGPFEERDAIDPQIKIDFENDPCVHLAGFQRQTEAYYAAMDIVTLPTYREGFPNVPLEASAMGLPVVATDVPGCTDAVVHDETGVLVAAKNAHQLRFALELYIDDPKLRKSHGKQGRERMLRDFDPTEIWTENLALYRRLVNR